MADEPKPDAVDGVDDFYARYLETCRRLGVDPVSLERAQELFGEWDEAIRHAASTKH